MYIEEKQVLDEETVSLTKNGEEIQLTPTEFKILALLMSNPGRVYTKVQIYIIVVSWNYLVKILQVEQKLLQVKVLLKIQVFHLMSLIQQIQVHLQKRT